MKSAPAIAFDYRPSRRLMLAVVLVCILAMLALWLSGLPWWGKLGLIPAAVAYAVATWLRMNRNAPGRVAWQAEGHWNLLDAQQRTRAVELESAVVRGNWIFLNFRRRNSEPVRIVLGPDNCEADTRRRLRVRLAAQTDVAQPSIAP